MNSIEELENFSVKLERITSLIQLASYMQGRFNIDELPGNEEIRTDYPFWIESLLDFISENAKNINYKFDDIIKSVEKSQNQ